jgi:transcriptional regulator with XRE-family HTH domain
MDQLSPEAKRLAIVLEDFPGSMREFSALVGIHYSTISRMLKGDREISIELIKAVCFKLGYSAGWFITGTGNKKSEGDEVKLITEISMLRTEMEIMLAKNNVMESRLKTLEGLLETQTNIISKITEKMPNMSDMDQLQK